MGEATCTTGVMRYAAEAREEPVGFALSADRSAE
jgi:hypothetical protein